MSLELNASITGTVGIPALTGSLLGTASSAISASYVLTSSYAQTSQQLINYPIFQNGKSKFAWTSYFNGNPTGSGATVAGNATFISNPIYDGIRLTANSANQSGSVYWSGSAVSVENGPVWTSFWVKTGAGALGQGTFFYFNANRPITGSTFANISKLNNMGIATFVDIFDVVVPGSGFEYTRIYNNTGSNNTRTFLTNDEVGKTDLWSKYDMLFFKSGSNYYGNYWLSRGVLPTLGPDQMFTPFLLPNQSGSAIPGSSSLLDFGTTWPTGSYLGVHAFTSTTTNNSELFANTLEIKSGYLLPQTYASSLNFGAYGAGGFS